MPLPMVELPQLPPTHLFGPDSADILTFGDVHKNSKQLPGSCGTFCLSLDLDLCETTPTLGFSGHNVERAKTSQADEHETRDIYAFTSAHSHHAPHTHSHGHTKVASRPHLSIDNMQNDLVCLQEANEIQEANEDRTANETTTKGAVHRCYYVRVLCHGLEVCVLLSLGAACAVAADN